MPTGAYLRTEEYRENMSKVMTGLRHKPMSQEGRMNIGKAQIGRKHSEETRRRMSKAHKGREAWNKGISPSSETKRKLSEALVGRTYSEETKRNMSKAAMGKPKSTEARLHMSSAHKGVSLTQFHKDGISKESTRRWQNPTYKNKVVQAMVEASHIRPTSPELIVHGLLELICPGEYEYTGDGKITLGGMCPDFFCINNKKKVVEMFGDYWHRGENSQVRIDKYFEFGYDCLVIWEHELKNRDNVIAKIREFSNRVRIHHPKAPVNLSQQSNMFDILDKEVING